MSRASTDIQLLQCHRKMCACTLTDSKANGKYARSRSWDGKGNDVKSRSWYEKS